MGRPAAWAGYPMGRRHRTRPAPLAGRRRQTPQLCVWAVGRALRCASSAEPAVQAGWGKLARATCGPSGQTAGATPQPQAWLDEWVRLGSGRFCLGPMGRPQQGEPPELCSLCLETRSQDRGWRPPEAPGMGPSRLSQPLRPRRSGACGRTFRLPWGRWLVGAGPTRELRTVSPQAR